MPIHWPAEGAPSHHPTCRRCGSLALRRSHSRGALHRLVRRTTPWNRYACRTCGHRGWVRGALGPRHAPATPVARNDTPSGRRPESRDRRLKHRLRTRALVLALLSLALGILAAFFMQRCGLPVGPPD